MSKKSTSDETPPVVQILQEGPVREDDRFKYCDDCNAEIWRGFDLLLGDFVKLSIEQLPLSNSLACLVQAICGNGNFKMFALMTTE